MVELFLPEYESRPRMNTAIHVSGHNNHELQKFCGQFCMIEEGMPLIFTADGNQWVEARIGDFVILSNHGTFYVSDPECFHRNYHTATFCGQETPEVYWHRQRRVVALRYTEGIPWVPYNVRLLSHGVNKIYTDMSGVIKMTRPGLREPHVINDGDIIVFNGRGCYPVKSDVFRDDYQIVPFKEESLCEIDFLTGEIRVKEED